ncbi:MAG TPA: hypothetical protein VGE89_02610 [Bryobacteraceae bacterium]|jgi:hypothetical protein
MPTNKHGLIDSLKHMAFEDEPEKAEKPDTTATPAASQTFGTAAHTFAPAAPAETFAPMESSAPPAAAYSLPIDTGVVPDNDEAYRKLLSKTDFEGTDVAATIHKFLEPLKAIPDTVMPPNIKFKTAVLQAKAQAGLTEDSILAVFDTLKARLQQEEDAFNAKAQQFVAREITGRQDHIGQISAQITQLQQQLAQLSGELVEAQGKSTHVQSQFTAAAQRRGTEIEQQRAQYAVLLKG